jgi:hypothetical protein
MLGTIVGWLFDLLCRLWDGFWNVSGKLARLVFLSALGGLCVAALGKLHGANADEAWYLFKIGGFIASGILGIRLLINEVGVPLVHAQEERERQRKKMEFDLQLARERAMARQEDLRRRLRTLN